MLKGVDETALHVSALLSPHRSIHKPLSSSHRVEEELYRIQPVPIAVIDEAPRRSSHVSRFEEAEGSSSVSPQDSLSSDGLLAHVGSHLSNIERRASRSEEHTSELQSRQYLVCRLLLEKKKTHDKSTNTTVKNPTRLYFQIAITASARIFC